MFFKETACILGQQASLTTLEHISRSLIGWSVGMNEVWPISCRFVCKLYHHSFRIQLHVASTLGASCEASRSKESSILFCRTRTSSQKVGKCKVRSSPYVDFRKMLSDGWMQSLLLKKCRHFCRCMFSVTTYRIPFISALMLCNTHLNQSFARWTVDSWYQFHQGIDNVTFSNDR